MDRFTGFVIAGQFGGPHTGVDDDIPLLKRILEGHMTATRVTEIESVHLVFRVDGPLAVYHCAKAEKLRRNRSRSEISIDLGVPMSAWEGRTRAETRLFLGECVEAALELLYGPREEGQALRRVRGVVGRLGADESGVPLASLEIRRKA